MRRHSFAPPEPVRAPTARRDYFPLQGPSAPRAPVSGFRPHAHGRAYRAHDRPRSEHGSEPRPRARTSMCVLHIARSYA